MKPPTSPEIVAAIIADYTAGMSSPTTAAKWGVSSNTVLRYARDAGVIRSTVAARAVAKQRRELEAKQKHEGEHALVGGRWVQDGLVQRWVADVAAEPITPPEPIACPCGARISEPCRTAGGNWTRHVDRVTSRRCPCGNVPREGSHFCTTECQAEARAATYRRREERTPTRDRRAA